MKEREEVAEQGILFKVFIIYVPLTTVGTFGTPTERCLADRDENRINSFKGTVSRDFLLLVFFMNQFPPSPRVSH